MFERFFKTELPDEEKEAMFRDQALDMLRAGVNRPAIIETFEALRKLNIEDKFGFTNNRLLNITRDAAVAASSIIEHTLYGGQEETASNINETIAELRAGLSEDEQRS